jgi:Spy/CpxP family protein refolding chaperone
MRKLIYAALSLILAAVAAQDLSAQESKSTDPQAPATGGHVRPFAGRGRLPAALGLSPDQIARIRQINAERRPLMEAAQKRLREANRALDAAIYADEMNEADVEAKLADVQGAQAAVSRLRYTNELAVRQVLSPEQLARFRELRKSFEDRRKAMHGDRNASKNMPAGPFRHRGRGRGTRPDPAETAPAPQ